MTAVFANRGAQLLHGLPVEQLRAIIGEIGIDLVRRFVNDGVTPEADIAGRISLEARGAIVPSDFTAPAHSFPELDDAHPLLGDVGPTAGAPHAASPPLIEQAAPSPTGTAAEADRDARSGSAEDLAAARRRVSMAIAGIADAWTEYAVAMRLLAEQEAR